MLGDSSSVLIIIILCVCTYVYNIIAITMEKDGKKFCGSKLLFLVFITTNTGVAHPTSFSTFILLLYFICIMVL